MTTFSTSLKLELISDGSQVGTWGQTTNKNLGTLLEQAITGVQNITMVDANYTLTNFNGISDEARNAVIIASGANSDVRDIIAPLVNKLYVIYNNTSGGHNIRIRGASGLSVTIPPGIVLPVYCNGTNFYSAMNGTSGSFYINGDGTVTGALTTGAISGTTATFSGAISSVSPAFTGTPTAPTAAPGTSTTQIATTAFVTSAISAIVSFPAGGIVMWSGSVASIPSGWHLCNGANGTPDLRDRFIVGAGNTYAVGATGGSKDAIVVAHSHPITDPGHSHSVPSGGPVSSSIRYETSGTSFFASQTTSPSGTGISVNATGSSGTDANLPPYYALCYIMKA